MTTRVVNAIAVFKRPFVLKGIDDELPAGRYLIETEEQQLEALSFVAYRRVATTITLPRVGGGGGLRQVVDIDPDDLAAQQLKDTEGDARLPPAAQTANSDSIEN
ncbi:MAG: hypothetical protein WC807_02130 [Hyphomicrobium sp.]|jgi:hypothetical protein